MLQIEYLLANIGFDPAENEAPKVCMKLGIDPPPALGLDRPNEYRSGLCTRGAQRGRCTNVCTARSRSSWHSYAFDQGGSGLGR